MYFLWEAGIFLKDVPNFFKGMGSKTIGSQQNYYQNILHVERTSKSMVHPLNRQNIAACKITRNIKVITKF